MRLYRVFPWDPAAAANQSGGALFSVDSGDNRISNIDLYKTFYLAAEPEAAVAEALGHLFAWRPATFLHGISPLALADYELADSVSIFALDDVDALRTIGIQQPSRVITRDRTTTQAWARIIYQRNAYIGACWWSYYNPDWKAYGLWNISSLRLACAPKTLTIDSPAVVIAAKAIAKQRLGKRSRP